MKKEWKFNLCCSIDKVSEYFIILYMLNIKRVCIILFIYNIESKGSLERLKRD